MPLLIVIFGILLLFILIARFKLDAFISFITVCIFVGLFQGMQLQSIVESIQKGIGDTLGFLVLILGFGAMLGKLVAGRRQSPLARLARLGHNRFGHS